MQIYKILNPFHFKKIDIFVLDFFGAIPAIRFIFLDVAKAIPKTVEWLLQHLKRMPLLSGLWQ